MGAFADRVFAVVKQIPRGKVATYGQIARIIVHLAPHATSAMPCVLTQLWY